MTGTKSPFIWYIWWISESLIFTPITSIIYSAIMAFSIISFPIEFKIQVF